MRWGTFWRTLQFDLCKCSDIIIAVMLLHNFIIEHQVDGVQDNVHFANFNIDMQNQTQMEITQQTGEVPRSIVSDNNEPRMGHPTTDQQAHVAIGNMIRECLTTKLAVCEMTRPMRHNVKHNQHGHIYVTS